MSEGENEEREFRLMDEQDDILYEIDKLYEEYKGRGRNWNRFRGNTVSNIIALYLEQHVPSDFKVLKLAYVEGCPTEFDVMIVSKDAEPLGFTDAYQNRDVKLVLEVKGAGVFYKQGEVKKKMSDIFRRVKEESGKPILYLSAWEAKAHVDEVREALGSNTAFILRVEGEDTDYGEWGRFLDRVIEILKSD